MGKLLPRSEATKAFIQELESMHSSPPSLFPLQLLWCNLHDAVNSWRPSKLMVFVMRLLPEDIRCLIVRRRSVLRVKPLLPSLDIMPSLATKIIPANSHALCMSLTPADQKHRSHASRKISHTNPNEQQKFN